MLNRSYEGS
jgi:hypothetical protein